MKHDCIMPGCREDGRHALTIRLRRPDTSAIFAPNTGAYLCDKHAEQGLDISIILAARKNGQLHIQTWGEDRGREGVVESYEAPITSLAARRRGST